MTDGPKQLTSGNWLQLDPAFQEVAGLSFERCIEIQKALLTLAPGDYDLKLEGVPAVTAEEWIGRVLRHKMNERVPPDIRTLFRGAQAMLAYGCFYYPIATLALEQLLRVLEAAVTVKCRQLSGPAAKEAFQRKLKWLCEQGIISQEQWLDWDAFRSIRNSTSHPQYQMLMPPAMADRTFAMLCEGLSNLFSDGQYRVDDK
jgi:hypothetical protein